MYMYISNSRAVIRYVERLCMHYGFEVVPEEYSRKGQEQGEQEQNGIFHAQFLQLWEGLVESYR